MEDGRTPCYMVTMWVSKEEEGQGRDGLQNVEKYFRRMHIGVWRMTQHREGRKSLYRRLRSIYYSVRKVSDFFFCENLVDLNELCLHEATLNLHTHA